MVSELESKELTLGQPLPDNSQERITLIINMIARFSEMFKNTIKGKYTQGQVHKQNISGGAIIKMMFNDLFESEITSR